MTFLSHIYFVFQILCFYETAENPFILKKILSFIHKKKAHCHCCCEILDTYLALPIIYFTLQFRFPIWETGGKKLHSLSHLSEPSNQPCLWPSVQGGIQTHSLSTVIFHTLQKVLLGGLLILVPLWCCAVPSAIPHPGREVKTVPLLVSIGFQYWQCDCSLIERPPSKQRSFHL